MGGLEIFLLSLYFVSYINKGKIMEAILFSGMVFSSFPKLTKVFGLWWPKMGFKSIFVPKQLGIDVQKMIPIRSITVLLDMMILNGIVVLKSSLLYHLTLGLAKS